MLWRAAERGEIALPEPGVDVNLHAHTFFSYNAYGYSPSKFAWLARKAGLAVAGIVDFDVLDGVDEFLEAGRLIGLKCCAGLESRVFVPEFATLEINSPGEPGVAYNMGVGFPRAASHPFLAEMRAAAEKRTRGMHRTRQRLSRSGQARFRQRRRAADAERQRDRTPSVRSLRAQGGRRVSGPRAPRGVLDRAARRRAGGEREAAGADPRQDDEAGRRRLCRARQGIVSRNGEDEPLRRRSGRDPDRRLARRRERGRADAWRNSSTSPSPPGRRR